MVKVNQISTGLALQAPFGGVKKSSTDSFKEQGAGAIEGKLAAADRLLERHH